MSVPLYTFFTDMCSCCAVDNGDLPVEQRSQRRVSDCCVKRSADSLYISFSCVWCSHDVSSNYCVQVRSYSSAFCFRPIASLIVVDLLCLFCCVTPVIVCYVVRRCRTLIVFWWRFFWHILLAVLCDALLRAREEVIVPNIAKCDGEVLAQFVWLLFTASLKHDLRFAEAPARLLYCGSC